MLSTLLSVVKARVAAPKLFFKPTRKEQSRNENALAGKSIRAQRYSNYWYFHHAVWINDL